METKNLADLYGLDPIPWSRALEALETGNQRNETSFLATTRPDGRPHLAGVGAVWDNGKAYFVSGAGTRKSRNVAQNPNCAISMSLPGIDLVIEGVAERVTDDETLHRLAKRYADGGCRSRSRMAPTPTTTARRVPALRRGISMLLVRPRSSGCWRPSPAEPPAGAS